MSTKARTEETKKLYKKYMNVADKASKAKSLKIWLKYRKLADIAYNKYLKSKGKKPE